MYGFDTIYYGNNLSDYLAREFGWRWGEAAREPRFIPFWSDLVERFDEGYDL